MSNLEACTDCAEDRAAGDFEGASMCRKCEGKGFHRGFGTYFCNQCKACLRAFPDMESSEQEGLVEAHVVGGYMSKHLFDMSCYTFSLCEKCLRTLFNGFATPPTVTSNLPSNRAVFDYADDLAAYYRKQWQATPEVEERFKARICNYDADCTEPGEAIIFYSGEMSDKVRCHKHIEDRLTVNAVRVPVRYLQDFKGLPYQEASYSREDLYGMANGYLVGLGLKGKKALVFKYLPTCVRDLFGMGDEVDSDWDEEAESKSFGGIWCAKDSVTPESVVGQLGLIEELASLKTESFDGGTLYYGPRKSALAFANLGVMEGFQMDHRYRRDQLP